MSPEQIATALEISDHIPRVILSGISGAKICCYNSTLPHFLLRTECPDLAVLQIGTNDLAAGFSPAFVASEVLNNARTLQELYHVQHVTVCSALFREGGIPDPVPFYDVIREFNDRLFFLCREEPVIDYHSHDGFWTTPISIWSRDGIHPNSFHGRKLYKKSIRPALFTAFSRSFTPLQ